MKTIPVLLFNSASRARGAVMLTVAVFSAVLLGGVSVQATTTSDWTSTSAADWNVPGGWTPSGVPANSTGTYAVDTNANILNYTAVNDTNTIGGLFIGTNSLGTVNMTGGTLNVSNATGDYVLMIGGGVTGASSLGNVGGPGVGNFNMSGGTLNVVRDTGGFQQDAFILGDSIGGSGTFSLSGGIANFWCGMEMAEDGAGTLNVSGGILVDTGWFHFGEGLNSSSTAGYGVATFNLSGGEVYIIPNTSGATLGYGSVNAGFDVGYDVTNATANISGGTIYCWQTTMGDYGAATDTNIINIVGGSLYIGAGGVESNTTGSLHPYNYVNISGGTFHTADIVVYGAGGVLGSTNNFLSDGTNWDWWAQLSVNLTNSMFAVTNGIGGMASGPGYVTFAPEANRTITLSNQWFGVGGFVVNGPGSVAMDEANGSTYTGGTTVSQGTLIYDTAQPSALISGTTVNSGGTLALASAQTNAVTGVATLNSGSTLALNNGGALFESSVTLSAGANLLFNESGAVTFTNVVTGPGNVIVGGGGGTVNVGNNLQNTGTISQTNGALVVNGTILDASSVTNSGPASVAPLLAQGIIMAPLGIGTNSSLELGTTVQPGTLNASNVILNGTWIAKINTATTVGGDVNDLLICSNLILNPSSVLSLFPQSAPSVGTYVLAEYVNCPNEVGLFTNATSDAMTLNYVPASGNTLGELQLIVGSSNPANLTWSATNGSPDINWDVNTSSNWTNSATSALDTFHQQDAVTFSGTPGATPVTNRVSVAAQVLPSSINITGGLPYIFSGAGEISGGTGINYNDTNTSGIYTAGNNYTGPVNINAGVLQLGLGGSSWLGTANTTYVNGGTLDLNGQNVGAEPLVLQGAGGGLAGTNGGAINNSASSSPGQSSGPLNITLAGNTTFNASGARWDIGVATLGAGGASFTGNGNNLVKIGNQAIWIHETGDIGVGNIDIQQGELGFEYTVGMGIPSDTVTVESGATLGIYQLQTNSLLNKQLVLNGAATLSTGGGAGSSNNFIGPITLNGTNTIATSSYPLNLPGNVTGTGGFISSGTGPLYLGGSDTYSGPTVIGAGGSIILGTGASFPDTSLIYLTPSANTVLGTVGGGTGTGAITLNSGQTLEGAGSINASNFVAGTGTSISLGTNQTSSYGTIIFTNNLTLNGNTNYLKISDSSQAGVDNDLIQVQNNLTLSGNSTVMVTPTAALVAGNVYTIMEDVNNTISGSANNLTVISTSPRYIMTPTIGQAPNTGYSAVQLNITGVAASLVWKGYLTPNWDLVTSNWYNIGTGNHDHFYIGDDPTFDDSSSVTSVVITNNVLVAGINMSNVVNNYTFSGGGVITGPLNMEGNGNNGGMLVLAMSNAPAFTTIDSSAGTLVFNLRGMTNYIVAADITDSNGNQGGTIIFGGTNTALLEGDNVAAPYIAGSYNPDFDGTIMVTNGILEYTNVDSLGVDAVVRNNPAFSPLIITNNGTLNFNGVAAGTANGAPLGGQKWIHISGSGYNGQGALTDTAANDEPSGTFCYLYLDTNATIGSMPGIRYDQHVLSGNAQQIEGNGFNLTFIGGGSFFINGQNDGDTHFGNIDVASTNGGRLAFQGGPVALGITTNDLMVEPGGLVTFYNFSNNLVANFGVQKPVWLKGNASIDSGGGAGAESNNFDGPIFLTGTNLIGTRYDMLVWGSIMDSNGPGGFVLGNSSVGASSAPLYLEGTNTYSGPTIISNETLYVGANSSLGLSTYVQVNGGATLDFSAMPVVNFGTVQTNQTMAGNGTVNGPSSGNLDFNAGGTLAIGLPTTNGLVNTNTFTLTINGSVVFNAGSTNYVGANKSSAAAGAVPADELTGPTSLTLGGTVVVTNYGGEPFVGGDSLVLFSAMSITTNSGFNIVPATPGPNLAWNISSIPVNGTLSVVSTLTVNPNPTNIVFSVVGTNLLLSWPGDHLGWTLQSQTNSLSVGISTNWTTVSGSSSVTNKVIPINLTNGSVFYRLTY